MKKLMSIAIVLVTVFALMIPVFSSAAPASADSGETLWVNCSNGLRLNLRAEPSTSARLVRRLDNGTSVEVMDNLGNGWLYVMANNSSKDHGYVMAKFLQEKKPGKYEITEREDRIVAVTPYMVTAKALSRTDERSVGLRTRPNKTSAAIRRLEAGDQLKVIARGKTWSKVVDPLTGRTGFAANDYLQVI